MLWGARARPMSLDCPRSECQFPIYQDSKAERWAGVSHWSTNCRELVSLIEEVTTLGPSGLVEMVGGQGRERITHREQQRKVQSRIVSHRKRKGRKGLVFLPEEIRRWLLG